MFIFYYILLLIYRIFIQVLKEANQPVPSALSDFGVHTKKKTHALYGNHFKEGGETKAMPEATKITFDD